MASGGDGLVARGAVAWGACEVGLLKAVLLGVVGVVALGTAERDLRGVGVAIAEARVTAGETGLAAGRLGEAGVAGDEAVRCTGSAAAGGAVLALS